MSETDSKTREGWLLYGAYGYTGRLIIDEAKRRGIAPVIAGRREDAVRALAEKHDLRWRAFDLGDPEAVRRGLDGVKTVLHAAGPFSATSAPMVDACLASGVHYLDVTGELDVFEACAARDAEAKKAGIVIMPGVGFDVVPSDCLALALHEQLPDADRLELAFGGGAGTSAGTARTMVEGMPKGCAIRRDGKIEWVRPAWDSRTVPFADKPRFSISIPWGDVSTAYQSTGIPNIVVYTAMPKRMKTMLWLGRPFMPLMRLRPFQALMKGAVDRWVKGPSEEARTSRKMQLWGRVRNADGREVEGTATTPEGYGLTAMTGVEIAERVTRGDVEPGARTPSKAFGARFIAGFDRCELRVPEPVEAR